MIAKSLMRLAGTRAAWNAGASYVSFLSNAIRAVLAIPIAVAFLDPEELGLWTVINGFLSYLLWTDLGIGAASGRVMAPAVVGRHQQDINAWWTTSRAALMVLGLLVIAVGLSVSPLVVGFLKTPEYLRDDALWLFTGGVIITGLGFPMRGVPGLLTAQHRLHWNFLIQALGFWINLGSFYLLLRLGWGLKAYLGALAATQISTWIGYQLCIIFGPDRPRLDLKGLAWSRFRKLLGLSSNMSLVGLVDTVVISLPAVIIGRLGGLSSVPVYNFSWRGPEMGADMVSRTFQSFYPGLQKLHVAGRTEDFRKRHEQVSYLTLAVSLMGAGAVLAVNRPLVQLLAGDGFFAGGGVTAWFAVAVISLSVSRCYRGLLLISGSMGKHALVAVAKLISGAAAAVLAWKAFGLSGLAAVFAILPLYNGIYGYFRGSRSCGFTGRRLSTRPALLTLLAMALVLATGLWIEWIGDVPLWESNLRGRLVEIPGWRTLVPACLVSASGLALLPIALRRRAHLENGSPSKQN